MSKRGTRIGCLCLAVMTLGMLAMFAPPSIAPVDRIVRNAEAYVEEHPDDASGYYMLARAHYLAWSMKSEVLPVYREGGKDKLVAFPADQQMSAFKYFAMREHAQKLAMRDMGIESLKELKTNDRRKRFSVLVRKHVQQLREDEWTPPEPDEATLQGHVESAVSHLHKAIELDGDEGLYHLTLASLVEQYAPRAEQRGVAYPSFEPVKQADEHFVHRQWFAEAAQRYAQAYELSRKADGQQEHRPLHGLTSLVSYEAAKGYQRVTEAELGPEADEAKVKAMKAHVARGA